MDRGARGGHGRIRRPHPPSPPPPGAPTRRTDPSTTDALEIGPGRPGRESSGAVRRPAGGSARWFRAAWTTSSPTQVMIFVSFCSLLAIVKCGARTEPDDYTPSLVFVRFDGVGCRACAWFDPVWSSLPSTFPGTETRKVDCGSTDTIPVCASIPPGVPVFAVIEGGRPRWYEGQTNIYALLHWVQTAVGPPDDGLQAHRNFDRIYNEGAWVGDSDSLGSGTGSTVVGNIAFVERLSELISEHDVRSIVDVGCGDFEVMKGIIELSGATYHGWDVSAVAIDRARRRLRSDEVKATFSVSGTNQQYEPADLLVVKDVLQHLPLEEGVRIVSQLHKYKLAVFVNDLDENRRNEDTDFRTGLPMVPGGYRSIDVRRPPFNLTCEHMLVLHRERPIIEGARKRTCVWVNPQQPSCNDNDY